MGESVQISHQLLEFFALSVRIVVGALLFVLVFLAAAFVAWIVHAVQAVVPLPRWLAQSAAWVEAAIWILDVFLFSLFAIGELIRAVRAFWHDVVHWKRSEGVGRYE